MCHGTGQMRGGWDIILPRILNELRFLVGYFKTHIHMLATLIVKPEKAWAQSGVYFSTSYFRTSAFSWHGMASEPFIILRSYLP
jgi:hypothetical protein